MKSSSAFSTSALTQLKIPPLVLRVLKHHDAPPLAEVAVSPADLADIASEAWRDGCLRSGHPEARLGNVPMRLTPIFAEGQGPRCAGFKIEVQRPDGQVSDRLFTFRALRHLADRATAPLLDADVLEAGDKYLFDVVVGPGPASADRPLSGPASTGDAANPEPATNPDIAVNVSVHSSPLNFLRIPIRPLLEKATPIALVDDELPPVFYTEDALARAESCARRGTAASIETGGALFGSLASCPETGEFFTLVHDVLAVEEADETKFSLSYTSRSWQRLQRVQRARQAAYPTRGDRLVGQGHGHPFRPNDGKVCAECAQRPVCTLSSAWASEDDQIWHRAVFARQPWALCHIFGLTARGDAVNQLFGLRDGRLQARGFHLLPNQASPIDSAAT